MKTRLLFGLLIALTITSCTNTGEPPNLQQRLTEMGLRVGEGNARIPRYRVNGWTPLDDTNLIITAGVNDKYLVRLFNPCLGLEGAFFIGFTTPTTRLRRFDNILVRSLIRGRERCNIQDIYHLERIAL